MTPMPVNPVVVVLLDTFGNPQASTNNLGNDLKVVVTKDVKAYDAASLGVPYASAPEVVPAK